MTIDFNGAAYHLIFKDEKSVRTGLGECEEKTKKGRKPGNP